MANEAKPPWRPQSERPDLVCSNCATDKDVAIVALAQAHGLTVLTSDENIRQYAGVKTLW